MKNYHLKNKKGFTLIELLLYMILLGLILTVFTSVFVMGIKVYKKEIENTNQQNENKIILDRIIEDIKNSSQVESTYDIYTSDSSTIILKIPAIDSNENILYEGTGVFKADRIIYTKSGNNLSKITITDPASSRTNSTKTLTDKTKNLIFNYNPAIPGSTNVEVGLTTEKTVGNDVVTINNTSKASLRND